MYSSNINNKLIPIIIILISIIILVYKLLFSTKNYNYYLKIKKQYETTQQQQDYLQQEVNHYQNMVNRLKEDNLDTDFLEEQIKQRFFYTKDNEYIIKLPINIDDKMSESNSSKK